MRTDWRASEVLAGRGKSEELAREPDGRAREPDGRAGKPNCCSGSGGLGSRPDLAWRGGEAGACPGCLGFGLPLTLPSPLAGGNVFLIIFTPVFYPGRVNVESAQRMLDE